MPARDDVFKKIRDALGPDRGPAAEAADLDSLFVQPGGAPGDIVSSFIGKVTAAGGETFRIGIASGVTGWLVDFVCTEGVRSVVVSRLLIDTKTVDLDALAAECPDLSFGIERASSREEHTAWLAGTEVGIGSAIAGFADNGAIAILSTDAESRALSLLTHIHVAVLHEKDIHASFASYSDGLKEGAGRSSAVTIVGGPSKTADIEKVLVTGVHGPKRFIVLILP